MDSTTYASEVGSIMYGMICSRQDLAYAIIIVSQFMINYGQFHQEVLKWVLRYLNGSLKDGLKFKTSTQGKDNFDGFVNSNYVGNVNTINFLLGFVFTLFGTIIRWKTNQQSMVALSTTQAECIDFVERDKEVIWMKDMIGVLGITQEYVKIN